MKGVLLKTWGGNSKLNSIDNFPFYEATEIVSAPGQEWSFWVWRVDEIAVESTLIFQSSPFINGITTSRKKDALGNIHTSERDLVLNFYRYNHEVISAPGIAFGFQLINETFQRDDGDYFSNVVRFLASSVPADARLSTGYLGGSLSAARLILQATDPVLTTTTAGGFVVPRTYERIVPLYDEDAGEPWSGDIIIRPSTFYTWSDGGIPTYDAATGARVLQ